MDLMKENGFTLAKARGRRYPAETITDSNNVDNILLLANTPTQAESLLHSQEQPADIIGLHVIANKTEFVNLNKKGNISTQNGRSLKRVDKFTYLVLK